jgi:large subunit ribosomal protein L10
MTVAQTESFRVKMRENGFGVRMYKNSLIVKALEKQEVDFSELIPALNQASSLVFTGDNPSNAPAKILKDFRGRDGQKPLLKAAFVEESTFIGDHQLEALTQLKSKQDLLGELVGLLQSPAKNVVGALQSGGHKLSGILKTLGDR